MNNQAKTALIAVPVLTKMWSKIENLGLFFRLTISCAIRIFQSIIIKFTAKSGYRPKSGLLSRQNVARITHFSNYPHFPTCANVWELWWQWTRFQDKALKTEGKNADIRSVN